MVLIDQTQTAARTAAPTILDGYRALPGTYDELVEAAGETRQHARMVASLLANMSADSFARCQALAELSLAQHGVTFSVYSDERGTEKVMPVCLVPRVIGATEWAPPRKGAGPAAHHAAALPRRPLRRAEDPRATRSSRPSCCSARSSYLPQLRGMKPPGGVRIHIAGIDLIRSPDGVLRVLEDNLRTPSGVSYVIENRLITKRVFPAAMDRIGVRRVDDYPTQLAETLRSVSPEDPESSTIVVLTPGPFNSAYFEHSFLARTMGIELVQAPDLFVDGDEVFVRTTRGPRRVHVIYRRTDDAYLDPEFFRPDSMLGVPGLMRAYAAGNVALANAPGNGVADDKAVYPFVPDMIRFYLDEEPILEQVATYVCAREADRAYVLEHLAELVVKAVDEAGGYGMLMGPQASAAERDMFRDRIIADPRRYIAQHRIELSTCPTWVAEERRIEPRRVDLRPYILTGKQGSLGAARRAHARRAPRADRTSSTPARAAARRTPGCRRRGRHVVISRVADHCFWFGRYLERAESTARLLQVTRTLALDAELPPLKCWRPVVIVSGQHPALAEHLGAEAAGDGEAVQRYMTWAPDNPVSIRTSIRAARESARSIREVLGHEIWEAANELYLWFMSEEAAAQYLHDRDEVYQHIRRSTQLCLGLLRSTMLHDEPLDFLWLGVMLERVGQTARMLDVHHHIRGAAEGQQPLLQNALWLSLLRACSGFEAYMRKQQGRVTGESVTAFLLFETRFPRSLRYCLRTALGLIKRFPPASIGGIAKARKRLDALDHWLDGQEVAGVPLSEHALLTSIVDETGAACGELQGGLEGEEAIASQSQAAQ